MMANVVEPTAEYATSKTVVWWDMDKCPLPIGYEPSRVGPRIDTELKNLGYNGPLTIIAFGDVQGIPYPVLQALSSSGVVIKHVLYGRMDIIFDFERWFDQNHPTPVTVMFITEAVLLSEVCEFLSERTGYNFLMAYTIENDPQPRPLPVVVSGEWLWHRLGLLRESGRDKRRLDRGSEMFACEACYDHPRPSNYFTCASVEEFIMHLDTSRHLERNAREHKHKVNCYILRKQDHAEAVEANALDSKRKPKRKSKAYFHLKFHSIRKRKSKPRVDYDQLLYEAFQKTDSCLQKTEEEQASP